VRKFLHSAGTHHNPRLDDRPGVGRRTNCSPFRQLLQPDQLAVLRHATYRPLPDSDVRFSGRSPAFQGAYLHLSEACARLLSSGRIRQQEPEALTAQLWSFVHGCITLELAEHFVELDDPVTQVLQPMGVNLAVGLGDERERAQASHEAGARLYNSITDGASRHEPPEAS
jgi:hypothetical protein